MRRPTRNAASKTLSPAERRCVAERAAYLGSADHKDRRSWLGLPTSGVRLAAGRKTTICPLVTNADRARATGWVRQAITAGQYRFVDGDRDFPKHVWLRDSDGQVWYGRCLNRARGEYKGWPIDEEERREIFR